MTAVLLNRNQILEADDLPTEDVKVPEWAPKGTDPVEAFVRLRTLTGEERDAFETAMFTAGETDKTAAMRNIRARLAAACIVDEKGHRIFTEDDVKNLGRKSGAALDRVFHVARRLSGLSEADVEEMAGNSGAAPSGGSTSGSLPTSD